MIDLTPVQTEIASICKTIGIKRLELIGSAARDDFCSDSSDIDVLVEFDGAHDLFHRYFACKRQLEELFKRKVDVVQAGAVKNPYVRQNIERDRVVVYGTSCSSLSVRHRDGLSAHHVLHVRDDA